jgi:hypothetical protein
MKRITKIISVLGLITFGLSSATPIFGNTPSQEEAASYNQYQTMSDPGAPGDPVPINDYLPVLLVAGAAIVFYAARKKSITE